MIVIHSVHSDRLIKSDLDRFESIDFLIKISSNETIQNFTASPIVDRQQSTTNIEHRRIHLMRIAFENVIKNVSREPETRTVNCELCSNAENQIEKYVNGGSGTVGG